MLLFAQNLAAQKTLKKSFSSEANKIVAEFDYIDLVEIVTTKTANQITIISNSEEISSSKMIIEEIHDKLFIKSIGHKITGSDIAVIKLSNVRPKYSSYQIMVPDNMNVDVSIINGNFNSENFHGNLHLKMEEGTVKMNSFKGAVLIDINIGNVLIADIEDCRIDVRSNLGKVNADFNLNSNDQKHFSKTIGTRKNSLNITAVLANIDLKSTLN